jgi:hypothetical protein
MIGLRSGALPTNKKALANILVNKILVETAGIEFASDQSARQPKVSNYNRDAATAIPVRVLRKCLFIHRDQSAFRTFLGHGSGTGRSSSLSRTVSRHDRCQAESRPSRAGTVK